MNLVTKGLSYQPSNGKVCQKYKCDHHCDMNLCWDIVSLTNKILAGNFCSRQVTVAHILAILADLCVVCTENFYIYTNSHNAHENNISNFAHFVLFLRSFLKNWSNFAKIMSKVAELLKKFKILNKFL